MSRQLMVGWFWVDSLAEPTRAPENQRAATGLTAPQPLDYTLKINKASPTNMDMPDMFS